MNENCILHTQTHLNDLEMLIEVTKEFKNKKMGELPTELLLLSEKLQIRANEFLGCH